MKKLELLLFFIFLHNLNYAKSYCVEQKKSREYENSHLSTVYPCEYYLIIQQLMGKNYSNIQVENSGTFRISQQKADYGDNYYMQNSNLFSLVGNLEIERKNRVLFNQEVIKDITINSLQEMDQLNNFRNYSRALRYDTLNVHFVRFLQFTYWRNEQVNFSVSLEPIDPPNTTNEPLTGPFDWTEKNTIVDTSTYLKFKKFIEENKSLLKTKPGSIGLDDSYLMEINLDYKVKFYLDSHLAAAFLSKFMNFLDKENVHGYFVKYLKDMIKSAKYAIDNKGKLPKEPN